MNSTHTLPRIVHLVTCTVYVACLRFRFFSRCQTFFILPFLVSPIPSWEHPIVNTDRRYMKQGPVNTAKLLRGVFVQPPHTIWLVILESSLLLLSSNPRSIAACSSRLTRVWSAFTSCHFQLRTMSLWLSGEDVSGSRLVLPLPPPHRPDISADLTGINRFNAARINLPG